MAFDVAITQSPATKPSPAETVNALLPVPIASDVVLDAPVKVAAVAAAEVAELAEAVALVLAAEALEAAAVVLDAAAVALDALAVALVAAAAAWAS